MTYDNLNTHPKHRRFLMTRQQVATELGVSMTTLWRLEQTPGFPKRVNRSKRLVGYFSDEIQNHIDSQQVGGAA